MHVGIPSAQQGNRLLRVIDEIEVTATLLLENKRSLIKEQMEEYTETIRAKMEQVR
jgi:hypothetical protein